VVIRPLITGLKTWVTDSNWNYNPTQRRYNSIEIIVFFQAHRLYLGGLPSLSQKIQVGEMSKRLTQIGGVKEQNFNLKAQQKHRETVMIP